MPVRGPLDHIDLSVRDPDRSIPFYAVFLEALGYRRLQVDAADFQGPGPRRAAWSLRYASGASFGIEVRPARTETAHDRYAPGLHHLAFHAESRDDVDRIHAALVAAGATVLDPPTDYGEQPAYSRDYYAVFFADPDGLKLEVAHVPASNPSAGKRNDPAYRIVPAEAEHVPWLPAIEVAAATVVPEVDLPAPLRDDPCSVAEFAAGQKAGTLWVALAPDDAPVGFALVRRVDQAAHLEELDVHPDHARRGLGRRLVEQVLDWARARNEPGVTLTTFAHLPYNAPFYCRLGFRVLATHEISAELAAILGNEARLGLRQRVAMRHALASEGRPGTRGGR